MLRTGDEYRESIRDGREVFYLAEDNKLMAADVMATGARFDVGGVRPLFEIRPPSVGRAVFDVSRDGQRFLVNTVAAAQVAPLTLVVNWPGLLKK